MAVDLLIRKVEGQKIFFSGIIENWSKKGHDYDQLELKVINIETGSHSSYQIERIKLCFCQAYNSIEDKDWPSPYYKKILLIMFLSTTKDNFSIKI